MSSSPTPSTSDVAKTRRAYANWVLAVLCLASIVAYIDRQIINLLVEPIKRDLQISDLTISFIQGASFALFYSLAAIPLGRLADGQNRKWLIIFGIFFWTLACGASGLVSSVTALFVARMFIGVGEATLTPAGYSLLADYFTRERLAGAVSFFLGSGFVGSGIALIIGGAILSQLDLSRSVAVMGLGELRAWQIAFLVAAAPGLLCLLLMLTVREPARTSYGQAAQPGELPSLGAVARFVMERRRSIGTIFMGFSLLAALNFGIGAWVPTFFIRTYGMQASDTGFAFGMIYMVLGTLGVVVGGRLADWLTQRGYLDANLRAGIIAGGCALPFVVSFPLVPTASVSLFLLAIATFFTTMPFGAGTAAIPILAPNRMRAQLMALYLLVANLLGQGCGPTLIAALTDLWFHDPQQLRYSLAIASTALLATALAVLVYGLPSVRREIAAVNAQVLVQSAGAMQNPVTSSTPP